MISNWGLGGLGGPAPPMRPCPSPHCQCHQYTVYCLHLLYFPTTFFLAPYYLHVFLCVHHLPHPLFPLPLFFQSKFIVHCCTPFQCKSLTIFPFTSVHFIKWDMGIQDKTFSNRPMVQSHEIRLLFAKLGWPPSLDLSAHAPCLL